MHSPGKVTRRIPLVVVDVAFHVDIEHKTAGWCNGSTTVSDTACLGSNPGPAATFNKAHTPEDGFMANVLKEQVLVLNKKRRPYDVVTVEDALNLMFRGKAHGIDGDTLLPVPLKQWLLLDVRTDDKSLGITTGKRVRVPHVVQVIVYERMPKRHLKNDNEGIAARDGKVCQYTNVYRPDGNVDHVKPRAKGGSDDWENKAWCAPEINTEKRDLLPEKFRLKLLRKPRKPEPMEACEFIRKMQLRPEWEAFF